MPFTEDGMVPDMIMNPHCFVGETLVSLPNGISRRLDSFSDQGLEKVMSYSKDSKNIVVANSLGLQFSGIKDVIKLTFIDGRELTCTPDHKFKVEVNGEHVFKQAQDLTFDDNVLVSIIGTEDKVYDDEKDWSFIMGDYTFDMKDNISRHKSLAFARLLGYNFFGNDKEINVEFLEDLNCILDDIGLLSPTTPEVIKNLNKYIIQLSLYNLFESVYGLPNLLLSFPKAFIREFLAGVFGNISYISDFSEIKISKSFCFSPEN